MLYMIVFIIAIFLDLYIAEKYRKKYNITQSPLMKYKYLNKRHKTYSVLVGLITGLAIFTIPRIFADNFNEIIEITIYIGTIGFLAFALLDIYYRKNTVSYKPTLKRIIYTYSFCILSFVLLALFL